MYIYIHAVQIYSTFEIIKRWQHILFARITDIKTVIDTKITLHEKYS